MVTIYTDTSFLYSLYGSDANSTRADAWRLIQKEPLPFSAFHRVELRAAFSRAVHLKKITTQDADAVWQNIESDLEARHLVRRGGIWHRTLLEAEKLAATHGQFIGSRSLDIIHVAAAKLMGMKEFCTFDSRQAELAARVGFQLTEL